MMYLDLDELEHLFKGRIFWSACRPNIAWFRRRDFLGDPGVPLGTAVRNLLKDRLGINHEGAIRMLTHLRYFGHSFNPVTFYYCFDRTDSRVTAIVANITNTPWGERHSYVLDEGQNIGTEKKKRFRFSKGFHVSPFLDMDMEYDWRFTDPGEELRIQMISFQNEKQFFRANLSLKKLELNGHNLARILWAYPPITLKVIAGIYWQALKLRMKGATFYTHPSKLGKP